MPRPLRIEYPGAFYYIASKGYNRSYIYKDDEDRYIFLKLLENVKDQFNWKFYAYSLMRNNYQLLVETPEGNLSKGMRYLNGVYTQLFNKRHGKDGHIFHGRFKSILFEQDVYLLDLCRYILLDSVKAKIVKYPAKYLWSSYNSTINNKNDIIERDTVLSLASKNSSVAMFENYILAGKKEPSPLKKVKDSLLLGNSDFIDKHHALLDGKISIQEIVNPQLLFIRPELSELFSKNMYLSKRNEAIYSAYIKYGFTQKELSDYLGLHYSTISSIIKEVRDNPTPTALPQYLL